MLKLICAAFFFVAAAWSGIVVSSGWERSGANPVEASLLDVLTYAAADQTPEAPGSGHGFLIDKHIAAGLSCDSCHAAMPFRAPPSATCLRCHGGAYERLAARTASADPNPHHSHQGDVPCASCHHVHVASENFCVQCHSEFDFSVP